MRLARWTGSAPLSGSSRISTVGLETRAAATLARWRMPFGEAVHRPVGHVQEPDDGQPPVGGLPVGHRVEGGPVAGQVAGCEPAGNGLVLRHEPDVAVDRPVPAGVAAGHPHLSRSRPTAAR